MFSDNSIEIVNSTYNAPFFFQHSHTLIFITTTLLLFFIFIYLKRYSNLFINLTILFSCSQIGLLSSYLILDRKDNYLSIFTPYQPKYNFHYDTIKFDEGKISFIASPQRYSNDINQTDIEHSLKNISIPYELVFEAMWNESIVPDPLSKNDLKICSLYFLINGKNIQDNNLNIQVDPNNPNYISTSWDSYQLKEGCRETVLKITKPILVKNSNFKITNTDKSIFNYEYPNSINETVFVKPDEEHNHNHNDNDDTNQHDHD